jgi:hypothetical protein
LRELFGTEGFREVAHRGAYIIKAIAEPALKVSFDGTRVDRLVLDHTAYSILGFDRRHLVPADLNEELLSSFLRSSLFDLLRDRFVDTQSPAFRLRVETSHGFSERRCFVRVKAEALCNRSRPKRENGSAIN